MEKVRLQKWLAQIGICSRRKAEQWIADKRLTINGRIAVAGDQVRGPEDSIELDGDQLKGVKPPKVYWMLHKPDFYLTSHKAEGGKQRIYDLPKLKQLKFRVFPVGRLDYRTEGLLLLTNDGALSHRLCHPEYKQPRKYQVLVNGRLSKEQLSLIRSGISLDDRPVRCEIGHAHGVSLGKSKGCWYLVTVREGRNRLVRRVFEYLDFKVIRLIRYGFGGLRLPSDLNPGHYRQLSSDEITNLKKSVDLF